MVVFMDSLLDLCFFLFSQTENLIVFIPTVAIFFCFAFSLIRRLMRSF